MAVKTKIALSNPTRFKKLAQFLAKALEYKYRFPTSPDYPSSEAAYLGRWSWIKTEQQQGIIPLARRVFKEYGRYYANDNEFVNRFVLGRQRRDPLLERVIQNDKPTEEQDMLAGRTEEEALRKEQLAPSSQKQAVGTAQTTPAPKIQLPPIPQVIIKKEAISPEQLSETPSPQEPPPPQISPQPETSLPPAPPAGGSGPSAAPTTPPLSATLGIPSPGFPKMPSAAVGFGKDFASNAGIFLKKNVTKYLTFGNMVSGIFTIIGAVAGGILTQGQALGVAAGAGGGAIGSSYLRSPEGRRFLGNFGTGTINRTVNFSSQFSTQSLFKGPPKKVWIGLLVGFLALTALGAAFPSLPTDEKPSAETFPRPTTFTGSQAPQASSDYSTLHNDILTSFRIDIDQNFSYDYLKWAWEKFWNIKDTKFFTLINPNNITISVIRDDTLINAQIGCNAIRMRGRSAATGQPYPESLFKVVLVHELSHIIDSCNPDSVSRKSQLPQIIRQEGYLTNYSANASSCVGSNNLNEDYAEMFTYYLNLNPEFPEQSLGIGALCEPTILTNPYKSNKPLHQSLVQALLGVSELASLLKTADKLSCPVDGGQISTPSYQANPQTGHCGEIYTSQGYICDTDSRRAKSVDILTGGPAGKEVKLPTINEQVLEWTFNTRPQDILHLNRSDCLPNEMIEGFNCGVGIAFQATDQDGQSWILHLLHMHEPSIKTQFGKKYSSGEVVGFSEAIHTHVTVGKNISGDKNFAIAGSSDIRSGWIPADLEMKMCM
ncbi:MAG: hypothetical protein Q8P92_04665 [Candidatus Daviesbacteria bacterium]|nr:hypothetical protein [Candidatus Daviesbacteria bacterium]